MHASLLNKQQHLFVTQTNWLNDNMELIEELAGAARDTAAFLS